MVKDATASEYLLTQKTAEEYRSKGYEVLREAPLDFLPDFRADLLVRIGDEVKVIEVKSRPSLAADPKITELARIIESKPGWSFELVLVGEPEKVDSPEGARSLENENVAQRIEQAQKSFEAGLPDAAFLLAWSASEAAIREMLTVQGVSNTSITSPGYVLDQGVFHGVISRNEYDVLRRMRKYRNAIVHGFSMDDFSDELIAELIATARRLATHATPVDGPNGPSAS